MQVEKVLASVLDVSESNDIYMSLDILIVTSEVNANKAKFEEDFIHEIVENKDKYLCIPLVCERAKLEKGKHKNLGHALAKNGTFGTELIGSFVDFYEKENNGVWELYGQARVMKRYPKVCAAILKLFQEKSLFFSVEVLVGEYKETDDKNMRVIPASKENMIIGDCIVTYPAEQKSVCTTLIAEAINNDIGGDQMEQTFEKFFENSKIRLEKSELDINQVQRKVYAQIQAQVGKEEMWDYYSTDFGVDYMIFQHYSSGDYYKVDYSVANNEVTIGEMFKVTKNYVAANDKAKEAAEKEAADLVAKELAAAKKIEEDKEMELKEKLELAEKELVEVKATIATNETLIAEKDAKISENETVIADLNEKVNTLSESVVLKDKEIAELIPVKEELEKINVEKAETERKEKVKELTTKYSKLLSEEVMKETEIAEAIEKLNETVLQAKVTNLALETAEKKDPKIVTASITDDIKPEGNGVVSKYITINK